MLLNGGQLDGARVLSRSTVTLMTSDHLGKITEAGLTPGELLLGTRGYTFGLGFAVRREDGIAGTPGRAGEFMWAGFAGTYFWVDPQEELIGILMTRAPGPQRVYYRKLFKQLVYAAIADEPAGPAPPWRRGHGRAETVVGGASSTALSGAPGRTPHRRDPPRDLPDPRARPLPPAGRARSADERRGHLARGCEASVTGKGGGELVDGR